MTKKSTNRAKAAASSPAIVLFGLDEANKPHAAHFGEAHAELIHAACDREGCDTILYALYTWHSASPVARTHDSFLTA